jgi:diaminopimelate epimerase
MGRQCGTAGLMQPRLLEDGQVCVDMGPPTLAAAQVPTTLPATRDNGAAVAAELQVTATRARGNSATQYGFVCGSAASFHAGSLAVA